jgi:hypothetical protein
MRQRRPISHQICGQSRESTNECQVGPLGQCPSMFHPLSWKNTLTRCEENFPWISCMNMTIAFTINADEYIWRQTRQAAASGPAGPLSTINIFNKMQTWQLLFSFLELTGPDWSWQLRYPVPTIGPVSSALGWKWTHHIGASTGEALASQLYVL